MAARTMTGVAMVFKAVDRTPAHGGFAGMLAQADGVAAVRAPDEMAAMEPYPAGPEAGFVTGANSTIDGGFTA